MHHPAASQRHRSQTALGNTPARTRLGGWLILIGAGLILLSLRIALFLIEDMAPVFTNEVWTALTMPGSPAYHPLNAPVLIFELVGNMGLLVCSLVVVATFFIKHRRFPFLVVVFLLAALIFYVVDYVATERLLAAQNMPSGGPIWDLVGAAVLCTILVPYFLRSQRVKNTFLNEAGSDLDRAARSN